MKKQFILLSVLLSLILCFSFTNKKNKEYLFTIETNYGDIKFILFDDTPLHKNNFIYNVENGVYDSTSFHRIIDGFMIQGGKDLKNILPKDSTIPAEIKHLHKLGAIAAARTNNPQKRSSNSQFYIVQDEKGCSHLDNYYTVFGQVMSGMDVVHTIAKLSKKRNDEPLEPVIIKISMKKIKIKTLKKFYSYDF